MPTTLNRDRLTTIVEAAQIAAVITLGTDAIEQAIASAAADEDLVDFVWILPLSRPQRYRMADAMMRGDIATITAIGNEVAAASAEGLIRTASCSNSALVRAIANTPVSLPGIASSAPGGRVPGPRLVAGGGPGESAPDPEGG